MERKIKPALSIFLTLVLQAISFSALPQSNCTVSLSAPATCQGDTMFVPITFAGWDQPNVAAVDLSVQISDTNIIAYRGNKSIHASFTTPVINTVNAGGTSKNIIYSWSNTTPGINNSGTLIIYKFLCKSAGSAGLSFITANSGVTDLGGQAYNVNWTNATALVNAIPTQPGVITGSTGPLFGSTQAYSIASVSGATSYTWSVPSGGSPAWVINSGQGSTTISTTTGIRSGTIRVSASNACGTGIQQSLLVSKYATANVSMGSSSVCSGDTLFVPIQFKGLDMPNTAAFEFAIRVPDTGMIGYRGIKYSHPSFTNCVVNSISGPGNSLKIIYAWSNTNVVATDSGTLIIFKFITKHGGTVDLNFISGNGTIIDLEGNSYNTNWNSGSSTISTSPAQPGVISGTVYPYPGIPETYSIAAVPGASSYLWTVPQGGFPSWNITAGQGTTSITALPGSALGTITVTAVNGCGSSISSTHNVISSSSCTVSIGSTSVCSGDSVIVPVLFSGWAQPGVGAISFAISISDTTILGYRGYRSEHPSFSSPTINYVNPGIGTTGQIWYGWSNTTAGSVASGTLLELIFVYKSNASAALSFLTGVNEEITDGTLPRPRPYIVTWNSGAVTPGNIPSIVSQPVNDTIFAAGHASYTVQATSGSAFSYQWQVSTGGSNWQNTAGPEYSGINAATLDLTGATAGMNGFRYRCVITNGCGSVITSVTEFRLFSISGSLRYISNNPYSLYHLSGTTSVYLYESGSGVAVDSVLLSPSGYQFQDLKPGNYNLGIKTDRTPGGINSTDALVINNAVIGLAPIKQLQRFAGETRLDGMMSAVDGLNCKKYYVHQISTFPMGDWVFAAQMPGFDSSKVCNTGSQGLYVVNNVLNERISSSDVILNIGALCVGDVNGSRSLNLAKDLNEPVYSGEVQAAAGSETVLPVYLSEAALLNAVSLTFDYPENEISITGITMDAPQQQENDLVSSVENGIVRISWSALSSLDRDQSVPFVTLHIRLRNTMGEGSIIKCISSISDMEFAGSDGSLLQGLSLRLPQIKVSSSGNDALFTVGSCLPNPSASSSFIPYSIPENGHVNIALFDVTGKCVKVILSEDQAAGQHGIRFSTDDLSEGFYVIRLSYSSATGVRLTKRKFVVGR